MRNIYDIIFKSVLKWILLVQYVGLSYHCVGLLWEQYSELTFCTVII